MHCRVTRPALPHPTNIRRIVPTPVFIQSDDGSQKRASLLGIEANPWHSPRAGKTNAKVPINVTSRARRRVVKSLRLKPTAIYFSPAPALMRVSIVARREYTYRLSKKPPGWVSSCWKAIGQQQLLRRRQSGMLSQSPASTPAPRHPHGRNGGQLSVPGIVGGGSSIGRTNHSSRQLFRIRFRLRRRKGGP